VDTVRVEPDLQWIIVEGDRFEIDRTSEEICRSVKRVQWADLDRTAVTTSGHVAQL